MKVFAWRMAISVVLFAIGLVLHYIVDASELVRLTVFLPAYLLVGYDILLKAARSMAHRQVFNEYFLMTVATVGAFILSAVPGVEEAMFPEAVAHAVISGGRVVREARRREDQAVYHRADGHPTRGRPHHGG